MGKYLQKSNSHGSLKNLQVAINEKKRFFNAEISKVIGKQMKINLESPLKADDYAWNEWLDFKKNTSYKECGVYKIRLTDLKDYPIEIPRFLDNDKDGILMIGSSIHTEERIKCFRSAMEGRGCAHAEGKRFNLIKKYTNFMRRYNDCKIQYSFIKLPDKTEAWKEEERLLKCYFKRYGEVPPLNNNLPKRYNINWESLNYD